MSWLEVLYLKGTNVVIMLGTWLALVQLSVPRSTDFISVSGWPSSVFAYTQTELDMYATDLVLS